MFVFLGECVCECECVWTMVHNVRTYIYDNKDNKMNMNMIENNKIAYSIHTRRYIYIYKGQWNYYEFDQ